MKRETRTEQESIEEKEKTRSTGLREAQPMRRTENGILENLIMKCERKLIYFVFKVFSLSKTLTS